MAHGQRGWLNYIPSGIAQYGSVVAIKADTFTAVNNGASLTPAPSQYDFWPAHRSDMRAVYGVDLAAPQYKDLCITLNPSGSLNALGANFSDENGNVYTVNALRTEKFRVRNLK